MCFIVVVHLIYNNMAWSQLVRNHMQPERTSTYPNESVVYMSVTTKGGHFISSHLSGNLETLCGK